MANIKRYPSYEMPPKSPSRVKKSAAGDTGEFPIVGGNTNKKTEQPIKIKKTMPKRPTPDYSLKMNSGAAAVSAPSVKKSEAVLKRRTMKKRIKTADKKTKIRERLSKFDYPFFTIIVVLLSFGIVMMFSASYASALSDYGDSYYFVMRQLRFIAIGIPAMILLSFIDYHIFMNKFVITVICGVSVSLMLLVMIIGVTKGGAERWIEIAGISVQPSEILKLAVIILFAYLAHTKAEKIKDFKQGYTPFLVCLFTACGLMILQPHLSGTIIIFLIGITMMFVGNCNVKHLMIMLGVFAAFAVIVYFGFQALGYDYIDSRLLSFRNPEADTQNKTYQTYQSLITIGSGGIFGLGLGNSRQKFSLLPETQNDFVFSVICEELGLVGAIFVILLFLLFVYRGFYIASRARDKFGMLLAVGITMQIGVQALLNIAVASNSVPNTGISLPFFSYGGSALLMQLAEMGIILNISRKASIE